MHLSPARTGVKLWRWRRDLNPPHAAGQGVGTPLTCGITFNVIRWHCPVLCPSVPRMCPQRSEANLGDASASYLPGLPLSKPPQADTPEAEAGPTRRDSFMGCRPAIQRVRRICRGLGGSTVPCPAFLSASTLVAADAREFRFGRVNGFSSAKSPSGLRRGFASVSVSAEDLRIIGAARRFDSTNFYTSKGGQT